MARENPRGKGSVLHVGRAHTNAPATETALSTKAVPKKTPFLIVLQRERYLPLSLVKAPVMVTHQTHQKVNFIPVRVEWKGELTKEAVP